MSGPCRYRGVCTRNALPLAELCADHQAEEDAGLFDAEADAELTRAEQEAGLPRLPRFSRRPHVLNQEALLPFEPAGDGYTLSANPQKPFKPRGLMLWGSPPGLNVRAVTIGAQGQLLVSWGLVPALWFEQAQTFEQVVAARAQGKEPASWGSWDEFYPGVMARLIFDAPAGLVRAVMWGHST